MIFTTAQLVFGAVVACLALPHLFGLPIWLQVLLTFLLFYGAMAAYLRWQSGKLGRVWQWLWAPGTVIVAVFDVVLFQVIIGTIAFRELPRELTFSERIQRHMDEARFDSDEYNMALWWALVLNNSPDEGHITIRRRR